MSAVADLRDLKRKIKLLLSQIQRSTSVYEVSGLTEGVITDVTARRQRPPFDPPAPGIAKLANEQIPLLRLLHAEAAPALKQQFVTALLAEVTATNAAVVVQTILEVAGLEDIKQLLDMLKDRYGLRHAIWRALLDRAIMESHRFTDADLRFVGAMLIEENRRTERFLKKRRSGRGMRVGMRVGR